jgi:hypothetical protein
LSIIFRMVEVCSMVISSCLLFQPTYKHISKNLNVTVSKVFDEIPQPEKVLKRHQNRDDPGIMAWDHYRFVVHHPEYLHCIFLLAQETITGPFPYF